jgi:hypothetical protein
MSHEPLDADARDLAQDAAEWLDVLENASSEDRAIFVAWLKKSPRHVEEMLHMVELDAALSVVLPRKPRPSVEPSRYAVRRRLLTLSGAGESIGLVSKEVDTYRRAIIQLLLQRNIDRDSAEDLFQELWLQVLEDSRIEILADSDRLGRHLYRAACERALSFRSGEISWIGGYRSPPAGSWQAEEPTVLEESLGHRLLAQCARELLLRSPVSPDRKVLEAFFLYPAPEGDASRCLNLTEIELGQALWRARQLFGEIIRERGATLSDPDVQFVHEIQRAAMYVASALPTKTEERAFELQMFFSPRCAAEVDVWRALKRGLIHVEHRRERVAC